jgi:hypothetical protein
MIDPNFEITPAGVYSGFSVGRVHFLTSVLEEAHEWQKAPLEDYKQK